MSASNLSLPKWVAKIRKDYAVSEQLPLNEFRQMVEAISVACEALDKINWWIGVGISREGSSQSKVLIQGKAKEAISRIEKLGK